MNCSKCKHCVVENLVARCTKNGCDIVVNDIYADCPVRNAEVYHELFHGKHDRDDKYGFVRHGRFIPYLDKELDLGYLESDTYGVEYYEKFIYNNRSVIL